MFLVLGEKAVDINEALAIRLDDRHRITGLEGIALGSTAQEIATFDFGDDRFMLLPG